MAAVPRDCGQGQGQAGQQPPSSSRVAQQPPLPPSHQRFLSGHLCWGPSAAGPCPPAPPAPAGESPPSSGPGGGGGGGGREVTEERGRKERPPPPTFWASAPVTATMRRMPLAMASSETMTNGEAWPEFCRWLQTTPTTAHRCEALSPWLPALSQSSTHVPPQNSMEVREPAVLAGSWSSSSTGTPMDTTRTGSG